VLARSVIRIFHTRVVGLTGRNPDGRDRQAIVARCEAGERLVLGQDPTRRHRHAIAVTRESGEPLGHLPRHWLRRIGPRMAQGWRYAAVVTAVTGGTPRHPAHGLAVAVFAGKPGIPDDVWESALASEIAPARRTRYLWGALAAVAAAALVWYLAR